MNSKLASYIHRYNLAKAEKEALAKAHPTGMKTNGDGYPIKRYINFHGLTLSVEQDKGDVRSGIDPDGHEWSVTMKYPYGAVKGAYGADKERLDFYIGDYKDAENVYVVKQLNPQTGNYDEDKCMLQFKSEAEAKKAYLAHYDSPKFFGGITVIPVHLFIDYVSHQDNWGKQLSKAMQSQAESKAAQQLLAQLGGDIEQVKQGRKENRAHLERLRNHHHEALEGMAPAIRDYRESGLSEAYLHHAKERHRAIKLLEATNPKGSI